MMNHRHPLMAAGCALALSAVACAEAVVEEGASPSLHGTEVDGQLEAIGGELVVDRNTRWFYDYFLTAEDELSHDMLRAEVVAEAHARLDGDAARRAVELFDAYVEFRREAAEVGRDEDVSLEEAADLLRDAHERHLGSQGALTGEVERIERAVAVASVLAADDLDDAEKADELSALMGPEDGRALVPARAHHAVRDARARGADEAEVFAIRSEMLGEDAARRLSALDEERAAWRARVHASRREAQQLRDSIADETARAEAVEALRAERFTDAEALRLEALERTSVAAQ